MSDINPEEIEWQNTYAESPTGSKRMGLNAVGDLVYGNCNILSIISASSATSSTATTKTLVYLIDTNTNNLAYTLNLFTAVGNGIGPATLAPVSFAV